MKKPVLALAGVYLNSQAAEITAADTQIEATK